MSKDQMVEVDKTYTHKERRELLPDGRIPRDYEKLSDLQVSLHLCYCLKIGAYLRCNTHVNYNVTTVPQTDLFALSRHHSLCFSLDRPPPGRTSKATSDSLLFDILFLLWPRHRSWCSWIWRLCFVLVSGGGVSVDVYLSLPCLDMSSLELATRVRLACGHISPAWARVCQ